MLSCVILRGRRRAVSKGVQGASGTGEGIKNATAVGVADRNSGSPGAL